MYTRKIESRGLLLTYESKKFHSYLGVTLQSYNKKKMHPTLNFKYNVRKEYHTLI